ncbi:hypothetical protein ASF58_13340 [Methylobacterium sp. Leaf125]|uniref:response regulator n=1 Tax=Methylobacterium sp. Leaf125 TaxID=1736265 RepID=UPI0006FB3982|nr:response regulator [Methylobacterium sp. Leaf125]KQQ26354.1 hypothetical protein ASF58_13340 [Methylobacterium sp. Leaf125]
MALTEAFAVLSGRYVLLEIIEERGTISTLPLGAVHPTIGVSEPAEFHDRSRYETAAGNGGLVLVNDGEAIQRNLMVGFMIRQWFSVHPAGDGRAGFDMAHPLSPCIVLLGVMMPEVDDWTIPAILRANTAARGFQMIRSTSWPMQRTVPRCEQTTRFPSWSTEHT